MSEKTQPVGVCDLCLQTIDRRFWYTSKGRERRYCSRDCRNTANSRAGAPARSAAQKEHVARGEWINPHLAAPPTPEEQARRARLGRLREVAAGIWRNPGLTPEAREINSRPHKHTGALASAIEKLSRGGSTSQLTPEEHEAHLAYRRQLAANKKSFS